MTPQLLRQHIGKSFIGVGVAFICYNANGQIFLAKRAAKARDSVGTWDVGAGEVELGQTLEETLRRELKEEYGITNIDLDFFAYLDNPRTASDGSYRHWLMMCFLVKVDPAELKIMEPEKFDDSGWFSLDNLPTPLHPQFTFFLPTYSEKLKIFLAQAVQNSNT